MKLICTIPKAEPAKPAFDYNMCYLNGFIRNLQRVIDSGNMDRDTLKRMAFYGVKYIAGNRETDDTERMLAFAAGVKRTIAALTPTELMGMFPVIKAYDGRRTESKDYFYSMERLKEHGLDTVIGNAVDDLLWDIGNLDLVLFTVRRMTLADELRRQDGQQGDG